MATSKSYKIQIASYDFADYLCHRGGNRANAAKRFVRNAKRADRNEVKREIAKDRGDD